MNERTKVMLYYTNNFIVIIIFGDLHCATRQLRGNNPSLSVIHEGRWKGFAGLLASAAGGFAGDNLACLAPVHTSSFATGGGCFLIRLPADPGDL